MADELKEEMTGPFENEEAQAEPQAGSGEVEKSPEEAAAEEAMMAMAEEEAAGAEAGLAKPEEAPEEIAADEPVRAMAEQEEADQAEEVESVPETSIKNLDLLLDINLQITVELGRKDMNFGDILQLGRGSIVELNKMADEPVDIYVNQSKIAQGEVVVVDEHFGVRVTKLLSSARMKKLG